MSTIARLVAKIRAAPAPVLFLDTCAILDVVRAPRDDKVGGAVAAAVALVRHARDVPPRVHLVVVDIVRQEWAKNRDSARTDGAPAIGTYDRVAQVAADVASGLGRTTPTFPSLAELSDDLVNLSETLLDLGKTIDRAATPLQAGGRPGAGAETKEA